MDKNVSENDIRLFSVNDVKALLRSWCNRKVAVTKELMYKEKDTVRQDAYSHTIDVIQGITDYYSLLIHEEIADKHTEPKHLIQMFRDEHGYIDWRAVEDAKKHYKRSIKDEE